MPAGGRSLVRSRFPWIVAVLLGAWPFVVELVAWSLIDPFLVPSMSGLAGAAAITVVAVLAARIWLPRWPVRHAWILGATTGFVAFAQLGGVNETLAHALPLGSSATRWIVGPAISLLMAVGLARIMTHHPRVVRVVAASTILFPAGLAVISIERGREAARPDVILVVMDTLRADRLSLYGHHRDTSPRIDAFAADARVFERAISPAPWTPSGHASLFTGLLPAEHGTDGDYTAFLPPDRCLAERLRDAGYATAALVNNPKLDPSMGWARGFRHYGTTWTEPPLSLDKLVRRLESRHEDWPWLGSTRRTLRSARRWWDRNAGHPRFLFLNLIDPHSPYGENHAFRDRYLDAATAGALDLSNDSEDYDAGLVTATGAPLDRVRARYDGDVRYLDHELGGFLDWLATRGDLDRALVILTSDHGERLGEQGKLGHQLGLDQVLLHVPLIVRHPGHVPVGRDSTLVQTHGVFATILTAVGASEDDARLSPTPPLHAQALDVAVAQMRHQGRYLASVQRRNPAFDPTPFAGDWSTAVDGQWKLVRSTEGVVRLHRVDRDPGADEDLSSAHPDVVARLAPYLDHLPPFSRGTIAGDVPAETRELIRSLGYAQ